MTAAIARCHKCLTSRLMHPFYASRIARQKASTRRRGVAQLARAPVSKTGGWGFETLHPCQAGGAEGATSLNKVAFEGFWCRGYPTR